ncbi:MAG: DUF433 domain-containing protein [Anaerolinea sp.]|nr:DUF433 domain-containing protein [Anaerolinea sp.]
MNTITLNHFSPPITDLGHYLKTEQGEIFLAGTRVGLWQIVQAYESGSSPEQIVLDFPALSLTQIYAAITYYLVNREILSLDADAPDTREMLVRTLREKLASQYQVLQEEKRIHLISHETPLSAG